MLAVRTLVDSPVVYVESTIADDSSDKGTQLRIDGHHADLPAPHATEFVSFRASQSSFRVSAAFPDDQSKVVALLESDLPLDLQEPFQRVQEALEETQLRKR